MNTQCTHQTTLEHWFDGEHVDNAHIKAHVEHCAACQTHLAFLNATRDAIEASPPSPKIADAQLPAFLEGIAQGIELQPRRRFTGLWVMASSVAAALIAAISMMSMITPTAPPVGAQTIMVEGSESTDIDGATIEYDTENETPTIWLNLDASDDGEI